MMINAIVIIIINSFFWVFIHFFSGFIVHFIPSSFYNVNNIIFKKRWWEFDGKLYSHIFFIKLWKDKLPECGELLGINPFSKKNFKSKNINYINRFILETCRGELAHLLPIILFPLCIPWNPGIAKWIMLSYALLANLPFIIIQRYNRIRLVNIYNKYKSKQF